MQAERLTKAALDPVAGHRLADRAWNGEAQAGAGCGCGVFARPAKGGEQRTGDAESVIIDKPEIGGAENPGRPGKGSSAAG